MMPEPTVGALVVVAQPVELAFRYQLNLAFGEFGGRIHELVYPPDSRTYPLAVYRRLDGDQLNTIWSSARIQLVIKHETYTAAKELQKRIEAFFRTIRRSWMGDPSIDNCPIWVWHVDAMTKQDLRDPRTEARMAVSDFIVRYAEAAGQ